MNRNLFKHLTFLGAFIFSLSISSIQPVLANKISVPIKYDSVSTDEAVKGAIPITLYFGKVISIDFTDVGEYITFIVPSDRSQFVYNTDLPIQSNQAQGVFLLPVKKINFKGTYQTSHPNLIIKTINSFGQTKQYNFIINFSADIMTSTGIKIVSPPHTSPIDSNKIRVSAGQTINADNIERGLNIALAKQFINRNDPNISSVRNFVFMLRNGRSVDEAMAATGVSPAVIESLGEMSLETELRLKLRPNLVVNNRQPLKQATPDYFQSLVREIERQPEGELKEKLKLALAELEAGNNPSQIVEKYGLSSKWYYKMMKVFAVSNRL